MSNVEEKSNEELVDSLVCEFEDQWQPNQIERIKEFVVLNACCFDKVVSELIRVDLELNWRNGVRLFVEDYRKALPDLTDVVLSEIAFEEYRCRHASGDAVNKSEYSTRLNIDVSSWPVWNESTSHTSSEPVFPKIGDDVLNFEILGILGKGAVGRVYLAKQKDLASRLVVIKVTSEKNAEPDSLAQLQHTNIVPIFSLHETESFQVICMPYLGLMTLRDVIRSLSAEGTPNDSMEFISTVAKNRLETVVNSVDCERIESLGRQPDLEDSSDCSNQSLTKHSFHKVVTWLVEHVARGLSHAHANNILHGDIKPENILLQRNAEPLILDFHLAASSRESNGYPDGGTIPYMAPEHLLSMANGGKINAQSDIYSAGILLYELLTGKTPNRENFTLDEQFVESRIKEQKSYSPFDDPRLSSVSPDLKSIISNCLAFDGGDRYLTADDLANDLNRHLNDLPLANAPNRSFGERSRKWIKRNKWITSISFAVSLLLIFGISASLIGLSYYNRSFRLEQVGESDKFIDQLAKANLQLSSVDHRVSELDSDIEFTEAVLADYDATSIKSLRDSRRFHALPTELQEKENEEISKTYYWLAEAYSRKSKLLPQYKVESQSKAQAYNQLAIDFVERKRTGLELQKNIIANSQRDKTKLLHELPSRIGEASPSELIELAHLANSVGQSDDAILALDRYLQTEPENYAAWLMKGNVHAGNNRLEDAEACFSVCIGLNDQSSLGYFYRALTRISRQEYQTALDDFSIADRLQRDDLPTILNMAICQIALGRLNDAEVLLTRALADPNCPTRSYFLRSRVRSQLGQDKAAERDFQTGIEKTPRDEISWISRGFAKAESDPHGAIKDFEKALELNPNSEMALQNLAAITSEKLNQPREAILYLDKIIQRNANNADQIANRGVLWGRLGERQNALNDADRAQHLQQETDILLKVAGIYAQTSLVNRDDAKIAIKFIARAAMENPGYVNAMIADDSDLDPVKNNPELVAVLDSIKTMQTKAIGDTKQNRIQVEN